MKILFVFLLSFAAASAVAQNSWKIFVDKKVLLNTSTEDEKKNVIKISSADLNKAKTFVVSFKEISVQEGWERTIIMYDEKDNELRKQAGKRLAVQTSELKALLDKLGTIKIYTINSPTDPKMKARVRIRRIHLCTVILQ